MDRPISLIIEQSNGTLWLGGLAGARDIGLLKEYSIGVVITAAKGITIKYPTEIKYIVKKKFCIKKYNIKNNIIEIEHSGQSRFSYNRLFQVYCRNYIEIIRK